MHLNRRDSDCSFITLLLIKHLVKATCLSLSAIDSKSQPDAGFKGLNTKAILMAHDVLITPK